MSGALDINKLILLYIIDLKVIYYIFLLYTMKFKGFHGSTINTNKGQRKRKATAQGVQNQLNKVKKKLKKENRMVQPEAVVNGTFSDTPVVTYINPTGAVGDIWSGPDMEGTRATLKSFRIKGYVASVGATNAPCRIDVILDKFPQVGSPPAYNLIYHPMAANVSAVALLRPAYKHRFKTLVSMVFNPVTNDGQIQYFDRFIRLNRIITTVAAGTYDVNNQDKNNILVVLWTENAANQPTYSYTYQVTTQDDN